MGAIGRERVASSLAWPYQIPNLVAAYKKVKRQT